MSKSGFILKFIIPFTVNNLIALITSFGAVHFCELTVIPGLLISLAISLLLNGILIILRLNKIFSVMRETGNILEHLIQGNFTATFSVKSNELYIAKIGNNFRQLQQMLNSWIYELLRSSVSIKNASKKISDTTLGVKSDIAQLAENVGQIRNYVEETSQEFMNVASSANELSSSSEDISNSSQEVVNNVNDSKSVAINGEESVQSAIVSMLKIQEDVKTAYEVIDNLNKVSGEISFITESISAISKQTNLLAINAAIEAARSGEHGKGFAVVADEVRKLAEETNSAAKKISHLISSITTGAHNAVLKMSHTIKDVETGVQIATAAGVNLKDILSNTSSILALVETISAEAHQQFMATDNIAASTQEVSAMGETTSSLISELSCNMEKQLDSLEINVKQVDSMNEVADHLEIIMEKFDNSIGTQMLQVCKIVAALLSKGKLTVEVLEDILVLTGLSEFHITNELGQIIMSTSQALVGFQFIFQEGSQTNDFLPLLKSASGTINQRTMFRDVDDELYKYVGVSAIGKPGIIQCGLKASNMVSFKGLAAVDALKAKYFLQ